MYLWFTRLIKLKTRSRINWIRFSIYCLKYVAIYFFNQNSFCHARLCLKTRLWSTQSNVLIHLSFDLDIILLHQQKSSENARSESGSKIAGQCDLTFLSSYFWSTFEQSGFSRFSVVERNGGWLELKVDLAYSMLHTYTSKVHMIWIRWYGPDEMDHLIWTINIKWPNSVLVTPGVLRYANLIMLWAL